MAASSCYIRKSCIVVTYISWSEKAKLFIFWPFKKKFTNLCSRQFFLARSTEESKHPNNTCIMWQRRLQIRLLSCCMKNGSSREFVVQTHYRLFT